MVEKGQNYNYIIKGIRKGDEKMIRSFYTRNQDDFLKYCIMKLNLTKDSALELYHETFLVFMTNCRNGKLTRFTNKPFHYLTGIARNLHFKGIRDMPLTATLEDTEPLTIPEALNNNINNSSIRNLAARIMDNFPEPCKTLLKEAYFGKLTTRELAEKLRYKNTNTLKSKKTQCLKRLKDKVQEELKKNNF